MAAFDYFVSLDNAGSYGVTGAGGWTGQDHVNPSSDVAFWAYIHPGHTGTATTIDYWLKLIFWKTAGSAGDLSITWEIKASGGSFVTLESGTVSDPGVSSSASCILDGQYTTSTLLPCEIQCKITDADATWKVYQFDGASTVDDISHCKLRLVGTVT